MVKRGWAIFCCLAVMLILSISVVSAGFFDDLWTRITGKAATEGAEGIVAGNHINNTCHDSGGGLNYLVYGYTWGNSQNGSYQFYDICSGATNLWEQYCSGDYPSRQRKNCLDFGQYYVCDNGACVPHADVFTPNNNTCTDTDGGKNYFVKGRVYGVNESGPFSMDDNCIHTNLLREWYCNGTSPMEDQYDCQFGCNWGACFNGTQNDTTPPILEEFNVEYNNQGNNTNRSIHLYAKASDYESGMKWVHYEFNRPSHGTGHDRPCGGSTCIVNTYKDNPESGWWSVTVIFYNNVELNVTGTKSVFVPPFNQTHNCTDTDGGRNYILRGEVFGINRNGPFSFLDFCITENDTLYEYYCNPGSPVLYSVDDYDCENLGPYKCVRGACVPHADVFTQVVNFFKRLFGGV